MAKYTKEYFSNLSNFLKKTVIRFREERGRLRGVVEIKDSFENVVNRCDHTTEPSLVTNMLNTSFQLSGRFSCECTIQLDNFLPNESQYHNMILNIDNKCCCPV